MKIGSLSFLILSLTTFSAQADDARLQQKVNLLEQNVQDLQQRIQKLESLLTKGGGFTMVATATCEINTPFDGAFTATELSEEAAKNTVRDRCEKKVPDKTQCGTMFIKCRR